MRIAVCEVASDLTAGSREWKALCARVSESRVDLFLLNEMPFGPWIAAGEQADPALTEKSERMHRQGIAALEQLGAPVVLGTHAVRRNGHTENEAFVWTAAEGVRGVHTKQYFPDEEGYYEARWYRAGESHFRVAQAGPVRVGFLICTELMFNEHARQYGRQGAQIIAVPRAVGTSSLARWLVAMRMAAIVSGCYVLSSNRSGTDRMGQRFGGQGWVIDPGGDLVAQTTSASPVAVYDLNLEWVAGAQRGYPCYVPEL